MTDRRNISEKISWWLLPPDYIRRRHPALQRLEDNPVFLQWARRRMRKKYRKRILTKSLFVCAVLFILIGMITPFNKPLLPIGGVLHKTILYIVLILSFFVFMMVLLFRNTWRSREVSRHFAGCNETLIKNLLGTPLTIDDIVYAGCVPLMSRAFILLLSILLPIYTILCATFFAAIINLSTLAYIIILILSIVLVLTYLFHADVLAIHNRLNDIQNLAITPSVGSVLDEAHLKHLKKMWLFDFIKGWAYFLPWTAVYLFIIFTYFPNDDKIKLTLLVIFALLSLITAILIWSLRISKSIERLALYYQFIMKTCKNDKP